MEDKRIIRRLVLTNQEIKALDRLLNSIFDGKEKINVEHILSKIKLQSDQLPQRIREEMYMFRAFERHCALNIWHPAIGKFNIGKTPADIPSRKEKRYATTIEVLHMLISSYLGEIFTWNSIQRGNIVNEIVPIAENINKPISSGANILFDLHTEDAFHPFAGEYLSLFCVRNPNKTATILSNMPVKKLDDRTKKVLFEPRFYVGANIAHELREQRGDKYMPVLFGHWDEPYFRINLNNMKPANGDSAAEKALGRVKQLLDHNRFRFVFRQGDILFIDNFKVAHGREIYKANYDGNDRWLKRLYLTTDLRKSRSIRSAPQSRILLTRKD